MTSLFYTRMLLVNFNVFSCFFFFFSVFVFVFFFFFSFIAIDSRHLASSKFAALLFQFFGEFKLL